MSDFEVSKSRVAEVNLKLAYAVFLGFIAWVSWPDSAKWWGFGFTSVLCGFASVAMAIQAIHLVRKIQLFEKQQREFEAKGSAVKSAGLASVDRMKSGGVIKDAR